MRRQEFLVNLTLLTIIGALVYYIYESNNAVEEDFDIPEVVKSSDGESKTETTYNPVLADAKYKKFGSTDLFKPLLTKTPVPPTPSPAPTPTPNINAALSNWKVEGILDGEAMLVDKAKEAKQDPEARWNMKAGDSRPVDIGKGEVRNVKVKMMDENADNPYIIFQWDEAGLVDEKILKMMDETEAPTGPQ